MTQLLASVAMSMALNMSPSDRSASIARMAMMVPGFTLFSDSSYDAGSPARPPLCLMPAVTTKETPMPSADVISDTAALSMLAAVPWKTVLSASRPSFSAYL